MWLPVHKIFARYILCPPVSKILATPLRFTHKDPYIMGLFYVPVIPNIMFFYVLSIMSLSYVQPRPLYIRKTHNKTTLLYYGSFLCIVIDNHSGRTL